MENAQRDARNKAAELQKLQHEYEKLRDQKEVLARENKKLTGKTLINYNKLVIQYYAFSILIR